MEALSSVKMTMENCLGTINMCLFWISLTMVTLSADCNCGTPSLWWPFFAKDLHYFTKVLSCMTVPGIIPPTGQLFMAVHLIGYGSVPILRSALYISLNPWEARGWQVIAIDADVKQVITSWLQTLDNSVFTLEYNPWNHCGANAEMVVVTTLRCSICFTCAMYWSVTITFWHESVCYLIFWKCFLYTLQCEQVNLVFWMVKFLCHLLIIFTMNYLL